MVSSPHLALCLLRQCQAPGRVGVAGSRLLLARLQPLPRVLTDGFQHREARTRLARVVPIVGPPQQALVDEGGDPLKWVEGEVADRGDHGLGCVQIEPTGEDGQTAEQRLFLGSEEVVAPGNRRAERVLAGRGIQAAAGQEAETIREPRQQRLGREDIDPSGGQLDGQGQAVQPPAGLGDGPGVGFVEGKLRPSCTRPLRKQRHCLDSGKLVQGERQCRVGEHERGHREHLLAVDPQADPTGGEDRQIAATREEFADLRRRGGDLLEVVQHQQEAFTAQCLAELGREGVPCPLTKPERLSNAREDEDRVVERGEVDEGTPSKAPLSSSATRIARRVLPTPPGPVRVRSRTPSSRSRRSAASTSRCRPTNGAIGVGRRAASRADPARSVMPSSGATGSPSPPAISIALVPPWLTELRTFAA